MMRSHLSPFPPVAKGLLFSLGRITVFALSGLRFRGIVGKAFFTSASEAAADRGVRHPELLRGLVAAELAGLNQRPQGL